MLPALEQCLGLFLGVIGQNPSVSKSNRSYPKLHNINLHNVTHSLISQNPRGWMFVVQISVLIVTSLSLISRNLSLMQTTNEVNPHPRFVSCVNMWSVFFFFFFLNVRACICHIALEGQVEWTTP